MNVELTIGGKTYTSEDLAFENSDRQTYYQVIVRNEVDYIPLEYGTPYVLKLDGEILAQGTLDIFTKSVYNNTMIFRIFT